MSEQNDDMQSYALMVVAGVVALVIAGVIALTSFTTMRGASPAAAHATESNADTADTDEPEEPDGSLYFDPGSAALPGDAADALARVADAARANPSKAVLISGYHDASGDSAQNAQLAKERAMAVRHALEANGVEADRLVLDKPLVALGGGDARQARRVEVRLR